MSRLWSFVRRKGNREILTWAGGGLVAVAVAIWAVFTYAFPGKSSANVQASCGSVAFVGNLTGSTVTAGGATSADCSRNK